ncbi:MAG: thioredoxin [Simkaniaceae bacterium]|nr:thioredoxin [Simkaniaceae bacterium]
MEELLDSNFQEKTGSGFVFIDFHAQWCGPCRMLAPAVEEASKHFEGKVGFYKVDVDACQETAKKFQVTSIPTMLMLKDGAEVGRIVGLRDANALKAFVEGNMS